MTGNIMKCFKLCQNVNRNALKMTRDAGTTLQKFKVTATKEGGGSMMWTMIKIGTKMIVEHVRGG